MKKLFRLIIVISFLFSMAVISMPVNAGLSAMAQPYSGSEKMTLELQATLAGLGPGEKVTVIVTMQDQADLGQVPGATRAARLHGVIRSLQAQAEASQRSIQAHLQVDRAQGKVDQFTPFWVFNGLAVTGNAEAIQSLAARQDVHKITPDQIDVVLAAPLAYSHPEANLSVVNAPALWDRGWYGQGVVVASLDTGVDYSHPDLAGRWRGGSNSWYDPYGQHPTIPTDLSGHGTQTMGVMVAGEAGGTSIGVAPQASWMAAKIFNDSGSATSTAIHLAFQWLLDPDGNPLTDDAPHVVNNSWTYSSPGCNLEFQLDLQALRAAGILPVFAAGNFGPAPSTSPSPANYPEAFAIGAVNNSDLIYISSSRGPSTCGEAQTTFPDMVAPGVNIHTTDRYGFYTNVTGTSLAAPHATGALALLLSAFPNLSVDQQQNALINGAVDLGLLGSDNDFGYGRLNILASYDWLQGSGGDPTATSTSTPTATATPSPSPTPTATLDPNINLALGKPVTASSAQDSAHSGDMAVDGDLATLWQTARASGKSKLPAEWITVDLGSSVSISRAVLEWDAYYATSYTLQVSSDNATWTTVLNATGENGTNDILTFSPVTARYVKLNTTAWNSSSLRVWLKEFQVFSGGGSSPMPTPTSTPTPSTGGGLLLHIGDLDGQSDTVNRKNWNATVTVWVHDASENPIAGATVFGTWSGGISDLSSCITDASGSCSLVSGSIKSDFSSVLFTVTMVLRAADSYNGAGNHDSDGDSDGTRLTILKP